MGQKAQIYCNPINIRMPLNKYECPKFAKIKWPRIYIFLNFKQKYFFLGFLVFPSAPIYVLTLQNNDP